MIASAVLAVIVVINLTVGFGTTGKSDKGRGSRLGCCNRGTATSCVVKSVFAINYLLFPLIFALTLILGIALFLCYIMSRLCNDGTYTTVSHFERGYVQPNINFAENHQQIDLRQFAPILNLRQNETNLLLFENVRLKKLCVDYVQSLDPYMILGFVGFILMTFGFINYLINLTANWVRLSTRLKYAELFYINGAEMIAFGQEDGPEDPRY